MPELSPFRTLIAPGRQVPYGQPLDEGDLTGPVRATRVWAADVNGDGKLDLLVGDSVTLISPAKGLSEEEFKKRFAKWQEEFEAASRALNQGDEQAREKSVAAYNKAYQGRTEFMHEEMTGFVWLYLRK